MAERDDNRAAKRSRWLLPVAGVALVALVGVAVLAFVLSRPAQQAASQPASSAAAPTPSPQTQPSASPASQQTSQQEHERYRTYVSTVIVDATAVAAATLDLQGCRSDRSACVGRLDEASNQVSSFQRDLLTTPAPACLTQADELLRDGLGFLGRGFEAAKKGVGATNRVQVMQGILLLGAGWWRGAQAVNQARQADC